MDIEGIFQGGKEMNKESMEKEMHDIIYEECEKRWNKTHKTAWINGNMDERVKFYQEVKNEMLSK